MRTHRSKTLLFGIPSPESVPFTYRRRRPDSRPSSASYQCPSAVVLSDSGGASAFR
jgi:hypothetical protein